MLRIDGRQILAGQQADYIVQALADYKSGKRKNPIMVGQAKPLSREEVENLSAYYASLPGDLRVQR